MKKVVTIIMLFSILMSLIGCNTNKIPIPKWISKECYHSKSLQDYTDYCKYFYDEKKINDFKTNKFFELVKESDIENIKSYFLHFEDSVGEESFSNKYDFDYNNQINVGDYFYIITKEGTSIGDSSYGKF